MQVYKARKGSRFRYSYAYMTSDGMLRAWMAKDLDTAAWYRGQRWGRIQAAKSVMSAQKWRLQLNERAA